LEFICSFELPGDICFEVLFVILETDPVEFIVFSSFGKSSLTLESLSKSHEIPFSWLTFGWGVSFII